MNIHELNRNEADMIVRHLIDEAFQEKGVDADYSGELTAKLCAMFEYPFKPYLRDYVATALEHCEEYCEIDMDIHKDLVFERETNTSNHAEVVGAVDEGFNIVVNNILDIMNVSTKWIMRYSS